MDRLGGYLNPAAFSTAARGTFGNVARTLNLRGPGQANWDLSLFKSFSVRERLKGQFRITSQVNFARMMQLGVRLFF